VANKGIYIKIVDCSELRSFCYDRHFENIRKIQFRNWVLKSSIFIFTLKIVTFYCFLYEPSIFDTLSTWPNKSGGFLLGFTEEISRGLVSLLDSIWFYIWEGLLKAWDTLDLSIQYAGCAAGILIWHIGYALNLIVLHIEVIRGVAYLIIQHVGYALVAIIPCTGDVLGLVILDIRFVWSLIVLHIQLVGGVLDLVIFHIRFALVIVIECSEYVLDLVIGPVRAGLGLIPTTQIIRFVEQYWDIIIISKKFDKRRFLAWVVWVVLVRILLGIYGRSGMGDG
jgi:hypothetical protein